MFARYTMRPEKGDLYYECDMDVRGREEGSVDRGGVRGREEDVKEGIRRFAFCVVDRWCLISVFLSVPLFPLFSLPSMSY